jgi:hypothetical protein
VKRNEERRGHDLDWGKSGGQDKETASSLSRTCWSSGVNPKEIKFLSAGYRHNSLNVNVYKIHRNLFRKEILSYSTSCNGEVFLNGDKVLKHLENKHTLHRPR